MTSETESMTGEEALSALVDGELEALPRDRILGRLIEDPELRARWARYHAGRASLEGVAPGLIGVGFSERVAAAVSAEPPIVAPGQLRVRRPFRGRAGAAIATAAAVAMVAVVGVLVLRGGVFESPAPLVAGNDPGATIVADADQTPVASGTFGEGLAPGEQERIRQRLAMYLSSHNRFAEVGEMPRVMPISRLVAFNAGP